MHAFGSAFKSVIEIRRRKKNSDDQDDDNISIGKCESDQTIDKNFSAEKFVDNLLKEGCKVPCDETTDLFNQNDQIPTYYDDSLYKKGQEFFYKNIFGLFFSKLLGLILLLTLPSVQILIMTNRSSTPLTAYKRYLATILHMLIWYDNDLRNPKLWTSIRTIKAMHNRASNESMKRLNRRINQMDMALTQFGFMGFALVRNEFIGVFNPKDEELRGFVHLWKNVGQILGMEERFNICRDNVEETKLICEKIIEKVFVPYLNSPSDGFEDMSKALIKGMWVLNPFLQHDVFLCYLHMIVHNSSYNNLDDENVKNLNGRSKRKLNAIVFIMKMLKYTPVRIFYKYLQILTLYIMNWCPFLAYYAYGRSNALVSI